MELTEARRAELMAYIREDDLDDAGNALLESMYFDAIGYMEDAGDSMQDPGTKRRHQYDQCVNSLVLDAWDHRGTQTDGSALTENPAFRRKINQLKLTEPVPE